jgi:hypothetical protein
MESVKHNSVLSTAGLWRQIGGGMARGMSGPAGANGAWAGQLGPPGTAPLRPAFAWRVRRRWTLISDPPHNLHRERGKTMAGIREVRVTTAGTRKAAVRVEYDDGTTGVPKWFLRINYRCRRREM